MSSSDIVIKVENLSKRYRIGLKEEMYDNFVIAIFEFIKSPFKNYRKYRSLYRFDDIHTSPGLNGDSNLSDVIWALRSVSFKVKKGEVLGIIGRNGAGKSTLLKILSRITEPTNGYAEIRGKVSSLLEVGTGFHPELTGRENVYLNGTVLGMTKKEVNRKFDEIVEFSGVEKFIDTPVKRYSSGMMVRLAFSVAAHLEPEILIVDEVLAVGDAEFQKKCLSKMEDAGRQGRTVLFVSHNMPAVNSLCDRVILLEKGSIVKQGVTSDVVGEYLLSDSECREMVIWEEEESAPKGDVAILRSVKVHDKDGNILSSINIRNTFFISMEYKVIKPGHLLLPHFHFFNGEGINAFVTLDQDDDWRKKPRPVGNYISTVRIYGNLLSEGIYYIHCNLLTLHPVILQFTAPDSISFQVFDDGKGQTARRDDYPHNLPGVVRPLLKWNTQFKPENTSMN